MKRHLVSPYRGIRSLTDPGTDTVLRANIFAGRMPERAFYYGTTAAALHGLPLPVRFTDETVLHVAVAAGDRRVEALGIVAHHIRVPDSEVIDRNGIRVTNVTRTWCDLAASGLTIAELVAAGDRIIWQRDPRGTIEQLRHSMHQYQGRRGARSMRHAVGLLSPDADSAPESELRVALHLAGFPPPDVNAAVAVAGFVLRPDLSWSAFRIAIEYEGDHHRVDRDQWNRDIRRQSALQEAGWRVYRATAEDYRAPHRMLVWLARNLPAT